MKIMVDGGCVDVIYCDFMKAFDKVPHRRLIQKLRYYGIEGQTLKWIEQFLLGRRQRVLVNGTASKWHEVLSGIPQGSVLGPILFVLYINTLPETIQHSEAYLFADDTKVFKGIFSEKDTERLQEDIDAMFHWTEDSLLRFHPDKCGSMRIGNSDVDRRTYTMGTDQHKLSEIQVEKDIGVFIDEKLSFESHMEEKIDKANAIMGTIRRTYDYLDEKTFKLLYKALVRPPLEFANQTWAPYLKKHITEIENVQRRATKQIPGLSQLTYEERLKRLGLTTLTYRRHRGDMIEMYKILTKKYDPEVSNFINVNSSDKSTRGHQYKMEKERPRLRLRQKSFVHRSCDLWNALHKDVVSAPSVKSFERRLDKQWTNQHFKYNHLADPPSSGRPTREQLPNFDLAEEAEDSHLFSIKFTCDLKNGSWLSKPVCT